MKRTIGFILAVSFMMVVFAVAPVANAASSINIGEYVQMGTYYGEPILWRCIDIDENGPLLVSDKIICIKPFDAAGTNMIGSHGRAAARYEFQSRSAIGSNYWGDSNIRSWLNSSAPAGKVEWLCGNPPDKAHVRDGYNSYSNEMGFLNNFSYNERKAIKKVTQKSLLYGAEYSSEFAENAHGSDFNIAYSVGNYDTAYAEYCTDKIFLLDVKQNFKIYDNRNILGDYYKKIEPTSAALKYSEKKDSACYHYWLRTPSSMGSMGEGGTGLRSYYYDDNDISYYYKKYVVGHNFAPFNGQGIRPAFYLNLKYTIFSSGAGTEYNPYRLGAGEIGSDSSYISSSTSSVYKTDNQTILNDLGIDTNKLMQNIKVGNHPIKGPSITFLGQTFYLFEFNGKIDLDFAGLPISVTVDANSKTLKFLFGFKDYNGCVNIDGSNNSNAYWSESYQKVKSMYKDITGSKVDTTKLWNQFSSVRSSLKKLKASMLVDADCSVAGYMELSYETGTAKFSEGGIILEAGIGGEFSAKVPAFPVAYVCMGLRATIDGSITVAYEKYISVDTKLSAALAANVGVGLAAFSKKVAYIEGGLRGTLGANMHIANGKFAESVTNPLTVSIKGDVYLKGQILGYSPEEKKWPIGTPVQLYPRNNVSLMSLEMFEYDTIDEIIKNSDPIPRDYLYTAMLMAIDDADKMYSDKNIYPYNSPALTVLSDGSMLLLWVDDLGTKNDINKTSLMYSVFNGEIWSEAKEIFETGAYNGTPAIYNDGNTVHILWSKAKTVFPDSAKLEDLIVDTELNYTCFSDGAFSEPVVITNNDLMEINYDICGDGDHIAIAWSENSDNNPFLTSGTNKIFTKECINGEWQEAKLAAQSSKALDELNLYYSQNQLNCLYTSINSNNNTEIFNNSELLTSGSYLNYCDGYVYYLSDNEIMKYNIETKEITETGLDGVNNFNICNGNAYTLVSNDFKCELYESVNDNGVFSAWKQVTEFDKYIRDYAIATDSAGEPIYALNLVDINDDENIYGASELAVCKSAEINALNVSAVRYDNDDVKPAALLPLSIDINNIGTTDINKVLIKITDSKGNNLSSGSVNIDIPSGTSATAVYKYKLPDDLMLHEITVTVTSNKNERNTEDNSLKTSIGYSDIVIKDIQLTKTSEGAVVTGKLFNTGYSQANNVVLKIYDSSNTDNVLSYIDCSDIEKDGVYNFLYNIPENYLSLDNKLTMYGLSFVAESDSDEADYSNNSDKIVFGELTEYTLSLVDGETLLDIIPVDGFADYEIPQKEGLVFAGWYTSSTFADGTRLYEIPDDISDNLILYARYVPEDAFLSGYISDVEYDNGILKGKIGYDYIWNNCDVIIGVYDGNKLIAASNYTAQVNDRNTSFSFSDELEMKTYTIKAFFWNISNMHPCSDSAQKVVNIEQLLLEPTN